MDWTRSPERLERHLAGSSATRRTQDHSRVWGYIGSYGPEANLTIEDVRPWKDLNEYGRTTTELERPETLDLDEGDYEVIELPAPYESA